jgi:hypothetical protein
MPTMGHPALSGHVGRKEVSRIELLRHMVGAGGSKAVYHTAGPRGALRATEGDILESLR